MSVQTNNSLSTQGDPSNAEGKYRPDYLKPWEDFLNIRKRTLESLYSVHPMDNMPRKFDSRDAIKTQGGKVASQRLASEADLQTLQRNIVETPVSEILEHLESLNNIRDQFGLAGGITFYNHLNTLGETVETVDELAQRLKTQDLKSPHLGPFTTRVRPDKFAST